MNTARSHNHLRLTLVLVINRNRQRDVLNGIYFPFSVALPLSASSKMISIRRWWQHANSVRIESFDTSRLSHTKTKMAVETHRMHPSSVSVSHTGRTLTAVRMRSPQKRTKTKRPAGAIGQRKFVCAVDRRRTSTTVGHVAAFEFDAFCPHGEYWLNP